MWTTPSGDPRPTDSSSRAAVRDRNSEAPIGGADAVQAAHGAAAKEAPAAPEVKDIAKLDGGVTIEEVYEPFLIQEGYIKRTSRGRELSFS